MSIFTSNLDPENEWNTNTLSSKKFIRFEYPILHDDTLDYLLELGISFEKVEDIIYTLNGDVVQVGKFLRGMKCPSEHVELILEMA